MSAGTLLAAGLLGGVGSVVRFLLDGAVSARTGRAFPWGILAVNLLAAFLLGVFVGAAVSDDTYRLLGTGLMGGLSTFSTWAFDSQRLAAAGRGRAAALNFGVSLGLGVTAAWAGRHIGANF